MPITAATARTAATPEDAAQAELPIQGMTCASCVVRVERALKAVPGVEEAHVNLVTQRASVTYDAAAATPDVLAQAIEGAGYEVPRAELAATSVELPIAGMTCANCVRRIEKALRAVPGVTEATVNLVTQRATVRFMSGTTSPPALVDAITKAGYSVPGLAAASPARSEAAARAEAIETSEQREQHGLRRDFILAATLSVPLLVVAMSHGMIPGTEGTFGRWLQFALATPVVFGPGRRFLRLAVTALRHRATDMNTLVSIGVLAAWIYSTIALVLLPATTARYCVANGTVRTGSEKRPWPSATSVLPAGRNGSV